MSSEAKYAVLQETNETEGESWYYFIKYNDNEEALKHLEKQLNMVEEWVLEEDLSTFDLDLTNLVSATTAKEMTLVDINGYTDHRKFDGKLQIVDFGLKSKHTNIRKLEKIFDVLGYGGIERFIDKEDFVPEHLAENDSSSSEPDDDEDEESSSSEEEEVKPKHKSKVKIEIPRIAKIKRGNRK